MLFTFCSCEKASAEQETFSEQKESFYDLQGENGFTGTLEETNALVSILIGEKEGVAYVYNGEEAISEWFSGQISDLKKVEFTNTNGAKITASLIGNSFNGEVTLVDGRTLPFNAAVNDDEYGGIYRVIDEKAEKAEIMADWIVQSEEDQRGAITFLSRELPNITLVKKNFEDINDGTSNTIVIKETSYSIFRYKVLKPPLTELGPTPPFVPIPYPNTSG